MAQVTLDSIVKRFADVVAVDDISLEIPDGSFTVLVGPSGCGKTTTLRLVAGLEKTSDGTLKIGDEVVNDQRAYERDIAMVFQNYALYPHKTVRENMRFALEQNDVDEEIIVERVEEAARLLEIDDLSDRRPSELSGGQQQRVALGRAIVRQPDVFLMDEPLSNLDAKLRVNMRAELNKLHERLKTTTIYVTHDQVEAMTLGDQIAVMDNGEIQQVGKPTYVYSNPRNKFVAGFLGSPSMNFIRGEIKQKQGELVVDFGSTTHSVPENHYQTLESRVGEEIIFGIRPEDITLQSDGLPAVVNVVEPQGEKTVLELDIGGNTTIKASINPDIRVETGEEVNISFEDRSIHYFDTESNESLTFNSRDKIDTERSLQTD